MKIYTKITLIYLVVCITYIVSSDYVVHHVSSPDLVRKIQTIKGTLFVVLTSALIYFTVRYYFNKVRESKSELQETKSYYNILFDKSPLPCFIIDRESLKLFEVNQAAHTKYGISQENFNELAITDFVKSYDINLAEVVKRIKKNKYTELLLKCHDKKGKVLFQHVFCQPILDDSKVLMVFFDVTKKMKSKQALMDKIVTSIENERKRISNELHDNIKQSFGILSGMLTTYKANEMHNEEERAMLLDQCIKIAKEGLDQTRKLSHSLAPGFDNMELKSSLAHLVNNFNAISKTNFELEYQLGKNLPPEASLNVYRIVQEAINNIITHAESKKAVIAIKEYENKCVLEIQDDGVGLPESTPANTLESLGMSIMRSRALKLNGSFEISGKPNHGTTIRVEIPLASSAN